MPVTIRTCDLKTKAWSTPDYGKYTSDPLEILQSTDPDEAKKCRGILQCSTSKAESPEPIVASPNGLIYALIQAWKGYHNLVLRPEDFWFVIVSQLSFYITANSETLRSHFVAHEGKKELHVKQYGTIETVDFGQFADQMADVIGENVKDPKLRDWVLPDFTTTTPEDKTVAAILFMSAMQKYFEYFFDCFECAIPEITLLGEREDWAKILDRLDTLLLWGDESKYYHKLLVPIFKNIVASFDDPTSDSVVSFWGKIVSHHGPDNMSGGKPWEYITGWLTGLFLWNVDGKARDDASWIIKDPEANARMASQHDATVLDGVYYPQMYLEDELIPAVASVPVTVREIDSSGEVANSVKTRMTAGICGFQPCGEPGGTSPPSLLPDVPVQDSGEGLNTVRPVSFWWIYEVPDEEEQENDDQKNSVEEEGAGCINGCAIA